jgi:hypothetical protein
MTGTVYGTAVTQTFVLATDSLSTSTAITNLCGSFSYTITPTGFLTVNGSTGVITLSSTNMAQIGTYSATLTAKLASYTAVVGATKSFSVTLVDPCLTTTLTLPTTIAAFSITAFSGVATTITFMPATDSKATSAGVASLCGPRVYTIIEAKPAGFTTIIPPAAGQEYTSAWTLSELSNSQTDVGSWTMTLSVTLQNYPSVPAATKVTTATVLDPCASATINTQALITTLTYQITFNSSPYTIMSFMMNSDSVGTAKANPMFCGAKKYATGLAWLSVATPADPAT